MSQQMCLCMICLVQIAECVLRAKWPAASLLLKSCCRWRVSGAKAFDKVCIIELSKICSTLCIKKKLKNCFCNNFVKFAATVIIFGALIAQSIYLCDVHLFSTSPNSRQHPTVLNADVPNCYIMLYLLLLYLWSQCTGVIGSNRIMWCKLIWGIDRFTGQYVIDILTDRHIDRSEWFV